MRDTLVWTHDDLAELLAIDRGRVRQAVSWLCAAHGFPRALPGLRGRFDPDAVRAWIARRGMPPSPPPPPGQAVAAPEPDWAAMLDRRAMAGEDANTHSRGRRPGGMR